MTRISVPRFLVILVAVIGGLWLVERLFRLVYELADILLLFGLAWLLKLLLDPFIRRLQRAQVPRGLAILIAYLLTVGGLLGGLLALTPQFAAITLNIPRLVQIVAARAEEGAIWLQQRGAEINPQALTNQIIGVGGQVGTTAARYVVALAQSLLTLVGQTALVVTISVFMNLADGHLWVLRQVVPPRWREEYDAFVQDVNSAYSAYIRSYFYMVALGSLMGGALLFGFRIPGIFVWLLMVFVLRLLPFIGGTLANILLILVFSFQLPLPSAAIAIGLLMVGQFVLTNILMPRIMGRELGINPLLVLFAVLLGAKIYGVAGILFAIPAAAVIATIVGNAVNRYLLPVYNRPGWWREEVTVARETLATSDSPAAQPAAPTGRAPIPSLDPNVPRVQETS